MKDLKEGGMEKGVFKKEGGTTCRFKWWLAHTLSNIHHMKHKHAKSTSMHLIPPCVLAQLNVSTPFEEVPPHPSIIPLL